jgi:hypothetical protein
MKKWSENDEDERFSFALSLKKNRKNVLTTQESNTPRVCNFKVRVQEAVLFESWQ